MGEFLEKRRGESRCRIDGLRGSLATAEEFIGTKGCVYLTGSFAREEASAYSDLDLFIVGGSDEDDGKEARRLRRLDEICIKAELIKAIHLAGIPDFSGDGEYLVHYTTRELVKHLGQPHDDSSNTFTARLLLLLESKPLLGRATYDEAINDVVASYWRDYQDHPTDFVPAFLVNDILRLWRTFCVNYEARTSTQPKEKKAKRKLKNFKLKHSRLLTCYSALAYLLHVHTVRRTVTPGDVVELVRMTPTERIERLAQERESAKGHVDKIIEAYEAFLKQTDSNESDLVERFRDKRASRQLFEQANELGNLMYDLLRSIDEQGDSPLYRLLLV